MSRLRTALTAAGIVGGAVLAANGVAVAATGHGFVLGRHNDATTTTTLHRTTTGVPLSLAATGGSAPLAVNSGTVVTHLNADKVDGKNAADLQTAAVRYVIPPLAIPTSRSVTVLIGVPHGIYSAGFNIVAGTSAPGTSVNCYLSTDKDQGSGDNQLTAYGSSYLAFSTSNSSGVVDFRSGTGLALTCFTGSSATFNFQSADNHAVVTLVRIDKLTVHPNSVQNLTRHAAKGAKGSGG